MQQRHVPLLIAGIFAAHLLCGCGAGPSGPAPGGELSIAAARETIQGGGVPDPDSITVESFLADHAIFSNTRPDAQGVFVNVDTAWHQDFDAITPQATIQIGIGTDIDPDTFVRGKLNLGLVIDHGRIMDQPVDDRSGTTKFDAVRYAVDRLLAQLTPEDLVSIVVFNGQSETVLEAAAGDDIAAIKGSLDGVTPEGDSNAAGGLLRGFQTVAGHTSDARLDRVLLFTDAQLYPGGGQRLNDALDVMRTWSVNNVGTTVFSVGSEFGDGVTGDIANVRGGNSFFLKDFDTIVEVFDEEFAFLVAPVVYDVALTVDIPFEFDVVDVQGLSAPEPIGHQLQLTVPTLFLSPRQTSKVAFVRLRVGSLVDLNVANTLGVVTAGYTTKDGDLVGRGPYDAGVPAGLTADADPGWFQTQSVRRGVLLLNTALLMKAVCADVYTAYLNQDSAGRTAAITRITDFLDTFDALAADLPDRLLPSSRGLSQERELLVKLRSNIGG